jgi:hypothetical protein
MEEINVEFTLEELKELGKLLYMANAILINNDYEHQHLVDDLMLKVYSTGYREAPGSGFFERAQIPGELAYTIGFDQTEECDLLIEEFTDDCMEEFLSSELAERDFYEKHGKMTPKQMLVETEFHNAYLNIYDRYQEEFILNGVKNLRLVKEE